MEKRDGIVGRRIEINGIGTIESLFFDFKNYGFLFDNLVLLHPTGKNQIFRNNSFSTILIIVMILSKIYYF